jgi:uncharacterized membrane protein YsdA (DUF1294 family)
MPYTIGIVLALLSVGVLGRLAGLDRDRAFYPTVLVVVATYYVLFAVMGGSSGALVAESIVTMAFAIVAVFGFRLNLWLVAFALVGHGVFDFVHGTVVVNPGVPPWWPAFCMSYDVVAGGFLAWLLSRHKLEKTSPMNLSPIEGAGAK